jgi:aldehyde:ferredoxin oxidoreductase
MPGGYAGKILEVDLTTKKIKKTPLDKTDAAMYIGGRGLGAKLFYDRVKPGTSYTDPSTPICYMSGPLNGLPAPSTARHTIVTRSASTFPLSNPKTTGICHTNQGGRFTPELKFAGYDAVVVTGKASEPVYIQIEDDKVEIKSAKKYWGMGNYALQQALDKDFGRRWRSVYIGPAGENGVRYANVITEIHRACGRGGSGAVMGSKNLKFIIVKGTNAIGIDNMGAWQKANKQAWQEMMSSSGGFGFADWRRLGTAMVLSASSDWGSEAVYNFKEGTYEYVDEQTGEQAVRNLWVGNDGCYMCPIACLHRGVIRTGRWTGMTHDGPEYEGVMMYSNIGIRDLYDHMALIAMADDMGLCFISMGNVLGFVTEAMEKGAITPADLDGIAVKWNDVDAYLELQKKTAMAEGCGKLLGQNLRAMVDAWGKDTKDYAIETKGQGWAAWNVRALPGFETTYLTANRGADHLTGADIATQNTRLMNDSLGMCLFPQICGITPESLNALLNAAAGYRNSMDDYWKAAERVYTLERSFNIREGFGRQDDTVPPRMYKEALSIGAAKGKILTLDGINGLLDKYYADRGWDKNGVPTQARLKELGLDFVSI